MTGLVESYFGLKRPPFLVSKTSGPVFMTESLRASAIFLRSGLAEGSSILGVSGEAGIGKSSLARAFSKLTGDRHRIAMLSGRVRSWDELSQVLMREFEVGEDRLTRAALEQARAKYGELLIVVDDAQFLTPNLLERICIMPQLRTEADEPAVQVVLLADLDAVTREDIRPLLAWLDLEARHTMQPLPAEDTHRYIDTRMRRAGWSGEPLICESGALALHRVSRGNPRQLSIACMEVLEQAAAKGLARIDGEFVVGCTSADIPESEEPLSAPTGAALAEESSDAVRSDDPADDMQKRWDTRFDRAPLTAASPSMELADVAESLRFAYAGPEPIESIRTVSRPMMRTKPIRLKPGATHNRRRGKPRGVLFFAGLFSLVAIAGIYTARVQVADLLREFGMNLLTAADVVESATQTGEDSAANATGAIERPVALPLPLATDLARN